MTKESREAAPRLVVRRLIRATREGVFAAWTDPQSVSQWKEAKFHFRTRAPGYKIRALPRIRWISIRN
jgi:uncharacterized protein YndB with AHSA1/START domain